MTVPSILLAIYAGLIALVLVLSSVNNHLHPAPEQVRRVTHAVERAALIQLISPARWGMAGAGVLGMGASLVGMQKGIPLLWTCLVPLSAALLSGGSLFLGTRMVHRAISSSVVLHGQAQSLAHCAREFMAAVLLTGGTSVALGWSIEILAQSSIGAQDARFLVLLGLLSAGFMCALCARAATSSAITSHGVHPSPSADPHGGSLAMLVGNSFHFPLLVLCVWSLLAMLSHLAFLPDVAGLAANTRAPGPADRILYSPLLQLLGLFAVGFGAWAVRVSEGEAPRSGWVRAALVTWALLLIGCWSFSSQLPPAVGRSTPVCMSGFLLLLPAFARAWPTPEVHDRGALGKAVGFLSLLTIFVVCAARLSVVNLSADDLGTILGAGSVAILPLAIVWLFASSLETTRYNIASLAFVTLPTSLEGQRGLPFLGLLPGLGLLIALVSLQTQIGLPMGGSALELGLCAACGGAIAALVSYLLTNNCVAFQRKLAALITPQATATEIALDLEAANKVCEEAISSRTWVWVLSLVAPSVALLFFRWFLGESSWIAFGLALGTCVFGVGHAWATHHHPNDVKKMTGLTSLSSCLLQFFLIFLMMSSF